jgi:prevent-host-death family protein
MREIGVRDLKASLSEVLRSVGRGEQVRVTMRGKPLADIVPAGTSRADDRLTALITEGRVTPASQPRPPRPPRLVKAARSASELVLAERDEDR